MTQVVMLLTRGAGGHWTAEVGRAGTRFYSGAHADPRDAVEDVLEVVMSDGLAELGEQTADVPVNAGATAYRVCPACDMRGVYSCVAPGDSCADCGWCPATETPSPEE